MEKLIEMLKENPHNFFCDAMVDSEICNAYGCSECPFSTEFGKENLIVKLEE